MAFVSCFFVLFGNFIKIGLNLDLFVQPALRLFIEVSKWLSSFFKAMFPVVNDLWVSKLKKAEVPCVSSWILNDSTGVVEVIIKLNLLRLEGDKASPLMLQSFDFLTLYTKIDLMDLKSWIRVLINKVFHQMFKLHCFKFLLVQKTALNFIFLWLKNKAEINLFENLHSFKVAEASDLISWLDFLLDNLFIYFGHCAYRQCIGIPMGTNSAVYLANFYLFTYEFDFIKCLLRSNTCPVVLHRLSMFIGLWMIFWFLNFQTLRISCT